jgi:hypothetical protein
VYDTLKYSYAEDEHNQAVKQKSIFHKYALWHNLCLKKGSPILNKNH